MSDEEFVDCLHELLNDMLRTNSDTRSEVDADYVCTLVEGVIERDWQH